jgi:hypothetical protein
MFLKAFWLLKQHNEEKELETLSNTFKLRCELETF